MELEDLCDALSSHLFSQVEWPVSHYQVYELLGVLDFERSGQTQSTVMNVLGEGVFSRFDVKEKLLEALNE